MTKVLLLIGSPQAADKSASTQAAEYFVKKYQEAHAGVEVETVRIADLGEIRFTSSILAGQPTEADMEILGNRKALLEKYKVADKIVLAAPMWNYGLPGTVKEAIDTFCAAGETFNYLHEPDAEGNISVSLLPGKKLLFIQAMGGQHKGTPGDIAFAQVSSLFKFIGTKDITYVAVENVAIPGVDALANAQAELDTLVDTF